MENEKPTEKDSKESVTQSIAKTNNEISTYLDVDKLQQIELLVDKLEKSSLAKTFIDKTYPLDKDGKPDYEAQPIETVNKADMVLCLSLGAELGMSPAIALSYGKGLNLQAIKKIEYGKKLGLDYMTSMDKIYVWNGGGREIIYTAVEIVKKRLLECGIITEIIEDGTKAIPMCKVIETGIVEEYNPIKHKLLPKGTPPNMYGTIIDAVKKENPEILVADLVPHIYRATVKLIRTNRFGKDENITISYSTQQAIDAGLLKGIKSDGSESKGKDNWNNHPMQHLIKMSIMIGGRLIAADVLNGVYIPEELPIINKDTSKFDNAEDAIFEEQ